jgi:ribosomal protein S15P/S13E
MAKKSEAKAEAKTPAKKLTQEEFEKRVVALSDKGLTSEKIGETLRKEGTHSKEYNKKISAILREKNKYDSPDLKNVKVKLERINKHFETNKQDKRAMREKERVFSKLRKLERYYNAA